MGMMSRAGATDEAPADVDRRASPIVRLGRGIVGRGGVVPLAIAHGSAAAGDAFVSVSLAGSLFFNVSPDASREQILLYLVVTMAPLAVLSPLVGPAVDRFRGSQRFVASAFYVGRAVACLVLAVTLLQLAFYPVALVVLILSKASGIVKQTLVQTLVDDPEELVATNARLARFATITAAIGVLAATALFAATGPEWTLRGAAVLLAIAAGVALRVRPRAPVPTVDDELEYTETHLPLIVLSSIGMLAVRAAVGFFVFTLAFTLRRTSEPAYVYGIAAALYGAGAFAGHSAAAMLRRRFREERLISLAIALPAAFTAVGVLGASVPLLMVISLLVGLSTTLARNAFDGLLQRRAPEALLGRAGARYETQFQLAWVFGGVLATPISLPPEVSMMLLTAIYVPAFVIGMRGVTEADRFAGNDDAAGRARDRLIEAHRSWAEGDRRVAVIEASAAADLAATIVGREEDGEARQELEALRRRALDHTGEIDEADVRDAMQLAERLINAPTTP